MEGEIHLTILSIFIILSGVFYLGYAIRSRDSKSYYFHSVVINEDKETEYLNIQLYVSILNGVLLIIAGLIEFQYDLPSFYIVGFPLLIHLNNFIAKMIAFRKGYLEDI